ncbi:hypothetical protein F5Y16DRAFT_424350 [Xylariaceae sp. FL0255]|nr:hypothetical protein F5Y16DRAFT_424350 [Xylariaceae sp. FL0255]
MPYHSSSPPLHKFATMDLNQSSYVSNYPPSTSSSMEVRHHLQQLPLPLPLPSSLPTQLPAPLLPPSAYPIPATLNPLIKRREPLSKALKLKRSHSTPNVRPQGTNESDSGALGLSDKKRSKLGYARSNMACGHCRKRKIRCRAVEDDQRCFNCIRLRRDCIFLPVDQATPVSSSTSRAGTSRSVSRMLPTATTSPPLAPAQTAGLLDDNSRYPQGPSNAPTYHHSQGMSGWGNAPPESPATPTFPAYQMQPLPMSTAAAWTTSPLEVSSRPEDAWAQYPVPTRSVSFSGDHSYIATPASNRPYDRRASVASDMYQPGTLETMPSYPAWQQQQQSYQHSWYETSGADNPAHSDGMYYQR